MLGTVKRFLGIDKKDFSNPYHGHPSFDFQSAGNIDFSTEKQQLGAYTNMAWVSIAVDLIVKKITSQNWSFTDSEGQPIEKRRIDESIIAPFQTVRSGASFMDSLEMIVINRLLSGNGYLLKFAGTKNGQVKDVPDTFFPIPSDKITPCLSKDLFTLEHYELRLEDGTRTRLQPEQVVHFRQSSLYSPYVGVGNITKMRLIAEGEVAALEYMNEFLEKKASPSMVITDETVRSVEDHERIMDLIRSKYEGKANSGKVGYFNGQGINVQQMSISQKDMQFLESREFDRQLTLSMFGVPLSVAGIPDANFATAKESRIAFLENTVNPILNELENTINTQHVWPLNENIKFQFDKHTTGDVDNIVKQIQGGLITPNRGSELLGEAMDSDDESRNTFYLPANLIPAGFVARAVEVAPEEDKSVKKKIVEINTEQDVDDACEIFVKSATRPKQFQVNYIRSAFISRLKTEQRFINKIARFFDEQEKRVINNLSAQGEKSIKLPLEDISVDLIFNYKEESDLMQEEMKGLHTSGVQRAVTDVNVITNNRVNVNLSNPFVKSAIAQLGENIVGRIDRKGNKISISDYTQKELQRLLTKAVNENLSINETQDLIQSKFDQWKGYRARRIARTEARAAWDAGSQVAYKEIGVQKIDIVGCTEFEKDSDCGAEGIAVDMISTLSYHPNHIGVPAPVVEP